MSSSAPVIPISAHALADSALASFLQAYWDPDRQYFTTYSDRRRHRGRTSGPADGLYSDLSWEAQLWDLVMDAHERTGLHEDLLHAVYDGFAAEYPTSSNDALAWWAQSCARAYELTSLPRYLDHARELLDVATNGPAAITAVKVYAATGDTQYLDRAQALYSRTKSNLHSRGGIYIGAATALYGVTRDGSYLSDALSAADWTVSQPYTDGVLPSEGAGANAILVRQLHRLAVELGQPQYLPFLRHNADQAWRNRRTSDGLIGPDWNSAAPTGPLPSLTAGAGAALLQIVAL